MTPVGGTTSPGSVRPPTSVPPGPLPPASAEEKVARLGTQLSAAREMLDRHESDVKALRSRLELADARLGELEEEHRDRNALGALVEAIATRVKDLETVAERVRVGDQKLREILDQNEKGAEERRTRIATIESTISDMAARLKSIETLLAAAPKGGAAAGAIAADDLRRIRGIGPKFERALHDLGVRTYAQIAEWTDADITRISNELGTRVDRIHREGWVAAAQKLCGK
jgi:predicted flap endonuclease-1-like 5' DNA nuclease